MTLLGSFRIRFTVSAVAIVAAAAIFGWLTMGAVVQMLGPFVEAGLRLFGLAESVRIDEAGFWTIRSTLRISDTGEAFDFRIPPNDHILILRSLPIFAALMLAPPYDKSLTLRLPLGILALLSLAAFSMIVVVNEFVVVAINQSSQVNTIPVPPVEFDAPALLGIWTNLSLALYYASVMVLPLIAPISVWAVMKPKAVQMLMQGRNADPSELSQAPV